MNFRSPPAEDSPEAQLLVAHDGVVTVSGYKNLAVCTWTGQATGPAAAAVARTLDRPEVAGNRQSYIHIIHNKLPLPDSAARNIFMGLMKDRASELACIGIVVLGTGFWASAMRNAVIGMRVFAPRTFEFRVFGSCEEVVGWLPEAHAARTGVTVPARELSLWLSAVPRFE